MSHGRRKIYTEATEITAKNVVEEVNAAYLIHSANRNEISMYLYYHNKTVIQSVHHHCKSIKARHFCPAFFLVFIKPCIAAPGVLIACSLLAVFAIVVIF